MAQLYNGVIRLNDQQATWRDQYLPTIYAAADYYGVPRDLYETVIAVESRFDPNAISPTGAIGLAQLTGINYRTQGINPNDPTQNLYAGARVLREAYDRSGSWNEALSMYNSGSPTAASGYVQTVGAAYGLGRPVPAATALPAGRSANTADPLPTDIGGGTGITVEVVPQTRPGIDDTLIGRLLDDPLGTVMGYTADAAETIGDAASEHAQMVSDTVVGDLLGVDTATLSKYLTWQNIAIGAFILIAGIAVITGLTRGAATIVENK